jgi:hypothetical protein
LPQQIGLPPREDTYATPTLDPETKDIYEIKIGKKKLKNQLNKTN